MNKQVSEDQKGRAQGNCREEGAEEKRPANGRSKEGPKKNQAKIARNNAKKAEGFKGRSCACNPSLRPMHDYVAVRCTNPVYVKWCCCEDVNNGRNHQFTKKCKSRVMLDRAVAYDNPRYREDPLIAAEIRARDEDQGWKDALKELERDRKEEEAANPLTNKIRGEGRDPRMPDLVPGDEIPGGGPPGDDPPPGDGGGGGGGPTPPDPVRKVVGLPEPAPEPIYPYECECCSLPWIIPHVEAALAHQLLGNALATAHSQEKEHLKKLTLSQIKYIAKQSKLLDNYPTSWNDALNRMCAHMLLYYLNPYVERSTTVPYINADLSFGFGRFFRKLGGYIVGFLTQPSDTFVNCVSGCKNGMGIYVSDGEVLGSEILVTPAPAIMDFCCGDVDVRVPFGSIRQSKKWHCEPKSYDIGVTIACDKVHIPRYCSHNELRMLSTRQCTKPLYIEDLPYSADMEDKETAKREYRRNCLNAFNVLDGIICMRDLPPVDYDEALAWFLSNKPEKYRVKIHQALERLKHKSENDLFEEVRGLAFPKIEALTGKHWSDMDPRCVTSMTDEYLAESGPIYQWWFKALLKHLGGTDLDEILKSRVIIATGMTPVLLGEIVTAMERLGYCVGQGDHSRFDGHCEEEMLDAEYWYYEKQNMFPDWFLKLIKAQRVTKGTTRTFTYSHNGKVTSGKINTSGGDSLINLAMFTSFCSSMKITDYYIVVCGDDHIVFVREEFKAQDFINWCRTLGHKNDFMWTTYDDLQFCSSWFCKYNMLGDRVMAPLAGKVMTKTFIPIKPLPLGTTLRTYCADVAVGFGFYDWYPVLGALMTVLRRGRKVRPDKHEYQFLLKSSLDHDPLVVAQSFAERYGFDGACLHNAVLRIKFPEDMKVSLDHPLFLRMMERDGVLPPL